MESPIAAFLMRWSDCELLPTVEACASFTWELVIAPITYRHATGGTLMVKVVRVNYWYDTCGPCCWIKPELPIASWSRTNK